MGFDFYFNILLFLSCLHCGIEASQNIALGKQTHQSSTFGTDGKFVSSRAVDGSINQDYLAANYCTHTAFQPIQQDAWWQVDLEQLSDIKSVKIYYRANERNHESTRRLNGFEIKLSTRSDNWRTKTACYTDPVERPYPDSIVTVPCVDQGNVLTVFNKNFVQVDSAVGPILELCEVQVYGCRRGVYGPDCARQCPSQCLQSACDPENGYCKFGCEDGWKGNVCETACDYRKFGSNCASSCHCRDNGCNNVNGTCFIPGCTAGWKGHSCFSPCSSTTFGENCASTCHCSSGGCDRINGRCYSQKCQPGWRTESCSSKCLVPTFGEDCRGVCNCATPGCNHVSGVCDHDDGCEAGWKGTRCNITCGQNTFGPNCIHQCHCLRGTCYPTNGTCLFAGCAVGWTGKSCSEACTENRFGSDCRSTCHCQSEGCDRLTGICKNPVCNDGWEGQRCDEACENGTFGFRCNSTCYCETGSCNHISGVCMTPGCQKGWQGVSCSERLVESKPSGPGSDGNNIIPMAVGIVVVVLLAALICGIIVFTIRRKRKNQKEPRILPPKFDDLVKKDKENNEGVSYMNVGEVKGIEPKNLVKGNIDPDDNLYANETISPTLIRVEDLKTVISQNKSMEFEAQYKKIPYGVQHPHTVGELEENKPKNRFLTTFPYDHARVVLNTLAGDPNSDYINASYIDGVNESAKYVATQGPRKNTNDDFWRMIWQIKCGKIVMLTNLVENGKVKCTKYWPDIYKSVSYGDFKITLDTDIENLYYAIKELKVTQTKTGEIRSIQHFHFTAWPDHGTPDPIQLMLFHRRYMKIQSDQSGPSVIHCSAGIGRTGTFIALDALYKEGQKTGEIDVSRYVNKMRENRMNMIQTKEQYVVLHEALLEAFQFKDTSHTKEEFRESIYENDKEIKEEFERLNRSKPIFDQKEAYKGAREKVNQSKNRNNNVLPVERYRPYLMSHPPSRNNYINAVILPNFREHVGFLATQYPLPDTVVDLWTMIHDHDSNTIVTLDKLPKKEKDAEWLPEDSKELVCGSFTIQQTKEPDTCGETKETELVLRYEETERAVKLFQYQGWGSNDHVPSSPNGILKLIEMVNSWKLAGEKGPITVICTDGAKCCGVFCLIYTIIQSLRYEDNIDIFQSVRLLQLRRPELFSSIEQYRFCYNAVQEYLESANVYYN